MRLEHGEDAPPGEAFRCRLQYRADFVGVMAVVFKHFGTAVFVLNDAVMGEAAPHALELRQSGGDFGTGQPQLAGDDEGGKRVQHVVLARHTERQREGLAALFVHHVKVHFQPDLAHVHRAHVRRLTEAVGAHRAADVAQNGLHAFVVNAQHRQPVERQVV